VFFERKLFLPGVHIAHWQVVVAMLTLERAAVSHLD